MPSARSRAGTGLGQRSAVQGHAAPAVPVTAAPQGLCVSHKSPIPFPRAWVKAQPSCRQAAVVHIPGLWWQSHGLQPVPRPHCTHPKHESTLSRRAGRTAQRCLLCFGEKRLPLISQLLCLWTALESQLLPPPKAELLPPRRRVRKL